MNPEAACDSDRVNRALGKDCLMLTTPMPEANSALGKDYWMLTTPMPDSIFKLFEGLPPLKHVEITLKERDDEP